MALQEASHLQGMEAVNFWCVIKYLSSLVLVDYKIVCKEVMKCSSAEDISRAYYKKECKITTFAQLFYTK